MAVVILALYISAPYAKDIIATTEDGKKVLLQANGSWRYVNDSKQESKPQNEHISLVEIIKNDPHYDFRNVRWGMSKKEVMASEKTKLLQDNGNSVEYEVRFFGYNCSVIYRFSDGGCSKAQFLIRQPHVDPALYFKDYDELKKYLTPLYGITRSDNCDWKNEMYRHDKSKWGFAVSLGFVTCRTQWRNRRTQITLEISGGNHQITTNLEYAMWKDR